jgi:5-methylcytosine-specific restriction enzyme subunit McrC
MLDEGEPEEVAQDDYKQIVDLLAKVLSNGINKLLKHGLDRNYILISEDTRRIKGRLDFNESIKRNIIKRAIIHCHSDELNYNVLHNQIIKTTLNNLLHINELDKTIRENLRESYKKMNEIDLIKIENKHFGTVQLNRNNRFYDFLMKICELIHYNLEIDESSGNYKFIDFIRHERKMATLFESFVRNFYRIELPIHDPKAIIKREDIYWVNECNNRVQNSYFPEMETDVSIILENRKIIIETKYYPKTLVEHYDKKKIRIDHIRQLYAYLKNSETNSDDSYNTEGILLYPETEEKIDTVENISGHIFKIRTINLNQNWRKIHEDLINMVLN